MAFSLTNVLADINKGLGALPGIVQSIQAIQQTGASMESTLHKVVTIAGIAVAAGASVGEEIPNPQIQAISTLVGTIVQEVFAASAQQSAPAPPPNPPSS